MRIEPAEDVFLDHYRSGAPTVVWTKTVADLETPVAAYMKLCATRDHTFLLESVEGNAARGRYSVLGFDPDLVFRAKGEDGEINRDFARDRTAFKPVQGRAYDALKALIHESEFPMPDGLPPMAAGIFGYLGYDMVRQMERLGAPNPDALGLPDAILVRPRTVLIFDSVKDEITIVTQVRPAADVPAARPTRAPSSASPMCSMISTSRSTNRVRPRTLRSTCR